MTKSGVLRMLPLVVLVALAFASVAGSVRAAPTDTELTETGAGTTEQTSPEGCQATGEQECTDRVRGSIAGNLINNPRTNSTSAGRAGIAGNLTSDFTGVTPDPTTGAFTAPVRGGLTLTDVDGSTLVIAVRGTVSSPDSSGQTTTLDATFTVRSGTGRFEGATGTGNIDATIEETTGALSTFEATLDGTLQVEDGGDGNDAPVAVNDTASTDEGGTAEVNVLDNDTDADPGDDLDIAAGSVTQPTNGTVSCDNETGACTYTPSNQNFNGTDTFTYRATDGTAESNQATVTITVNAVNDAPVAQDQAATTDEDTPKTITLRATDVDNQNLTFAIVPNSGPNNGTLSSPTSVACPQPTTPNERCANVTYDPNDNFNGTDSFRFTASDGTATSNEATVTITVTAVNDAPIAVADVVETDEDEESAFFNVLSNDIDIDSSDLDIKSFTQAANGTVECDLESGVCTYDPDSDFNGLDSFTYIATDGQADSNSAPVTVTINPVNDQPTAEDDEYDTNRLTLEVEAPGVLENDEDTDDDELTAKLLTGPSNASDFELNDDGSFTYTPNEGFEGTDTFTYQACDDGQSGNPPDDDSLCSDPATVTINVFQDCTEEGTNGDDTMEGTESNDIICGRKGSDEIDGLGGNDIIKGGKADDTILGGEGDDEIRGKRGGDDLDGEEGEDRVKGGRGRDTCVPDPDDVQTKSCNGGAGDNQYSTAP